MGIHYHAAPQCSAIDPEALEGWLADPSQGSAIIYASGVVEPRTAPGFMLARELYDDGRVELVRRGTPQCGYQWIAQRKTVPVRAPVKSAVPVPDLGDDSDDDRVLRAIRRRTRLNLSMATDAELAKECQLSDAARAGYLVRKLRDQGLILVSWPGAGFRRDVTVISTGLSTKRGTL